MTGRITEQDQIDAIIKHCNGEKRRIELENVQLKDTITEKLDLEKDPSNMGKEIKALLGHMNREKEKSE